MVVSDVGGFREIVRHGETGLTFTLARATPSQTIFSPSWRSAVCQDDAEPAYRELLERFDWSK